MDRGTFWSGFEHDPRVPTNAVMRASDRDRDRVSDLLGSAYADGRLTRAEFDERADQLAQARTLGAFAPIVEDLLPAGGSSPVALGREASAELHARAVRRYHSDRVESLTYLGPALICWVIWAWVLIQGHGTPFPWPIFVTMGTAMPAVRMWLNPQQHIESRERKLAKEIEKERAEESGRDALPGQAGESTG